MTDGRDVLFATPEWEGLPFRFDDSVAAVFPDMIERSIPGYRSLLQLTAQFAQQFAQDGTRVYDLGSALGASAVAMRSKLTGRDVRIVAVDSSAAMLERSRRLVPSEMGLVPVDFHCADIADVGCSEASFIVLNFTLQFVPKTQRDELLARWAANLSPGGALLLSEKISFESPSEQRFFADQHDLFRRLNGYTDLEIARKRAALEEVLVCETADEHVQRLRLSGFSDVKLCWSALNFSSWLARK